MTKNTQGGGKSRGRGAAGRGRPGGDGQRRNSSVDAARAGGRKGFRSSGQGPKQHAGSGEVAQEKIHKLLATAGVGSRRQIESWIDAGRIHVNGEVAHIGQRISHHDKVEVDAKRILLRSPAAAEVVIINKVGGTVCTRNDPEGRRTVFDTLPELRHGRWVSVGRLDMQTTGLLVLTNDGSLAHKMMHPSTGLDREYAVRINAKLEDAVIDQLKAGIEVDGENLRFSDVRYFNGSEKNFWYHVVLMEGKNREVRRLFESVGCMVSRLKRVRYGPIILPSWLKSGQWSSLQNSDVKALHNLLRLPYSAPEVGKQRRTKLAKSTCLLPYPELEKLS